MKWPSCLVPPIPPPRRESATGLSWNCFTPPALRISELVSIQVNQIDFYSRELKVIGKGSKESLVLIGQPAAAAIKLYLKHGRPKLLGKHRCDAMFLNYQGTRMTARWVQEQVSITPGRLVSGRRFIPISSAIASPPTYWTAAPICESSKNFWAMPRFRRPRYTPMSAATKLEKSICHRIRWRMKKKRNLNVRNTNDKNLRSKLESLDVDGILIYQPENRKYLSGFDGSSGSLLVTPARRRPGHRFPLCRTGPGRSAPAAASSGSKAPIKTWFPELVSDARVKRLGIEAGFATLADFDKFETTLRYRWNQVRTRACERRGRKSANHQRRRMRLRYSKPPPASRMRL